MADVGLNEQLHVIRMVDDAIKTQAAAINLMLLLKTLCRQCKHIKRLNYWTNLQEKGRTTANSV